MSEFDDRHLDFVARHYKEGRFDTQKAIESFHSRYGKPRKVRSINWMRVSGVAAAALLLVGLFFFLRSQQESWTELVAVNGSEVHVLPDGTEVTLSKGSTLRYKDFDDDSRKVDMSGKIWFDVARDEARPFEVLTENSFVRVLGTEFQVDATVAAGKAVEIYVAEGKVLFARNADSDGVILTEGMGALLPVGIGAPVVEEVGDKNEIAWIRGTFIFDNTPLKEVLTCLSHYYKVSFVAEDLSKKLSGEFSTEDLDLIIELIESALGVNILKIEK